MTGEPKHQDHDELAIRIFRALYREFDLLRIGTTYLAVPNGTLWFSGVSLGTVARQISEHEARDGAAQTRDAGTSEDGTLCP